MSPDEFILHLRPQQLLARKGQLLKDLYQKLLTERRVPCVEVRSTPKHSKTQSLHVQKPTEKLWCLFDLALQNEQTEFILSYLNGKPRTLRFFDLDSDVCFSPDLIPLSNDAYHHSTRLILDWSQKFTSEAEGRIMDVMRGNNDLEFIQLPKQLTSLMTILKHCLSKKAADPTKARSRSALVSRLIQTNQGVQLAAQVRSKDWKCEGMILGGGLEPQGRTLSSWSRSFDA